MGLTPPQADGEERERARARPWLILAGVLLVTAYLIAFVVKNNDRVTVDFIFFDSRLSLVWLILLCLGIGIAGGVVLTHLQRRRRRARSGGSAQ